MQSSCPSDVQEDSTVPHVDISNKKRKVLPEADLGSMSLEGDDDDKGDDDVTQGECCCSEPHAG